MPNKTPKWLWQPKPLKPPVVDKTLTTLDALTRSAECVRYSILSLEYWLSEDGTIRECLRHNGRLAVVIAIPVFLVLPVVTFGLWQLASALSALVSVTGKLIILPILILVAVLIISIVRRVLERR